MALQRDGQRVAIVSVDLLGEMTGEIYLEAALRLVAETPAPPWLR